MLVAKTLANRLKHLNQQFLELKHEVISSGAGKKNSRLMKMFKSMDQFWAQDVF